MHNIATSATVCELLDLKRQWPSFAYIICTIGNQRIYTSPLYTLSTRDYASLPTLVCVRCTVARWFPSQSRRLRERDLPLTNRGSAHSVELGLHRGEAHNLLHRARDREGSYHGGGGMALGNAGTRERRESREHSHESQKLISGHERTPTPRWHKKPYQSLESNPCSTTPHGPWAPRQPLF